MKYSLRIRKITEADLRKDCPYLPDDEAFLIHCDALLEDIKEVQGIVNVVALNQLQYVLSSNIDNSFELKASLTALFQRNFQYFRFASIAPL